MEFAFCLSVFYPADFRRYKAAHIFANQDTGCFGDFFDKIKKLA